MNETELLNMLNKLSESGYIVYKAKIENESGFIKDESITTHSSNNK